MRGQRAENDAHARPFVEHLDDLRRALIGCVISLALGMAIACPLVPLIVKWLKWPLKGSRVDPDVFLKVFRVGDGFSVAMQVVIWAGLLISLPGILISAARFIYPGLTPRERRLVTSGLFAATLLFVMGVLIGYFTTIRLAVLCMLQVNDWLGVHCDFVELSDYCGFVLKMLVAFGLVFEMPIIVLALGAVGMVSGQAMRQYRRHVIVGLMAVAMILTPPDPLSMVLMSVPLIALYECCIWVVWAMDRRRTAKIPA